MPSNRGKSPTHPFYGICVCGAEMTPLLAFFLHCPKQLLPKDAVILSSPTRRSKLCPRMNPSRIAPLARSSVPHPFACPGSPRIGLHPWGGYWRKEWDTTSLSQPVHQERSAAQSKDLRLLLRLLLSRAHSWHNQRSEHSRNRILPGRQQGGKHLRNPSSQKRNLGAHGNKLRHPE